MQVEEFYNPIDPDKITETPGTLSYAHNRGSAIVKPNEEAVIKHQALHAMHELTDMQLKQIRQQIELLANQAAEIQERKELSHKIYEAKISFIPVINHVYYLYQNAEGDYILSMISPEEWGHKMPFKKFLAAVKQLADRTWTKI
jgi:hypothetical protein